MTASSQIDEHARVADLPAASPPGAGNRRPGTDREGMAFPEAVVRAVWSKAHLIEGRDPDQWRCDICGATIRYADHGNTRSEYGWEVDHVLPVSKGGKDELSNLRPLQWEINRLKGDAYPW